jgi:hypothetical protein
MPLIFLVSLLVSKVTFANELMLSAGGFATHLNLLGQEDPPTYRGYGYYAELEYLMPFSVRYALSFFAIGSKSSSENVADTEIKEEISLGYLGFGSKFYFGNSFLSLSFGKIHFDLEATGEVEKTINADETGYEVGIGHRFKISTLMGLVVSLSALHSTLNPENGSGFYKDYDLWQYRGSIGLNFILPSAVEE